MILSTVCTLSAFSDPQVASLIRWLEPDVVDIHPGHPVGREHRGIWEQQHAIRALMHLGLLTRASEVLVINANTDRILYALTGCAGRVFAIDDYLSNETLREMLRDPRSLAAFPFDPQRLIVQNMDPASLRYPNNTFDAIVCRRFSRYLLRDPATTLVLAEIARVLKPGGAAAVCVDMLVDGGPVHSSSAFQLHTPQSLSDLVSAIRGLALIEEIHLPSGVRSLAAIPLDTAVADAATGRSRYPHILLEEAGRTFTSAVVLIRKSGHLPMRRT